MKTLSIGSVSNGTLRNADLLLAFAETLEDCIRMNAEHWCGNHSSRDRFMRLVDEAANVDDAETTETDELIFALQDALQEFVPEFCFFGAHPGDGSDFGCWPDDDAIGELPRVNDPSEVDGIGEPCVFVNDHGNMTVYAADGSIIFDCV